MMEYERLRATLVTARGQLEMRIQSLEGDVDMATVDRRRNEATLGPCQQSLLELVEDLRAQSARTEAATRRIDRREFDCCILCGGSIDRARLESLPFAVNCSTCAGNFPADYESQLAMQHRDLPLLLQRTRDALAMMVAAMRGALPEAELDEISALGLLLDLQRELMAHFAAEEKHGYLADILNAAPQLRGKIASLEAQHQEFRQALERLVGSARFAGDSPDLWTNIGRSLRSLTLSLLVHEELEDEIITSEFLDNAGSVD